MTRTSPTSLADQLEAEIRAGDYRPGERMPKHDDLGDRYGTSRQTAWKAKLELIDRGILVRGTGRDIFVTDPLP